ncbi:DUF262 domain-containing protein [Candidatus Lucifugimonas marina]|uniref:DUF262 domain-containing protein n=1 Tax=Candidatus Lucifugimonas marina TaxID=3038979 RepID=A0AAJ5ZCM2_9CHLR|nr:DUF262 domain-containing protein [SAR202 cluster bacterium JH702]MDG0868312.1 DUF262 domain-containing protein [SAR202 cluster bacterium JH639]WFG38907.1 DUF262 domain-containing protein [SAR202 cluster bacterium JH1073]
MKNAQKPDHMSLNSLVNRLKDGRYVIPDFQREFEWSPKDIQELVKSIFRDYYIGSLLLWKGKTENFDALSCEGIYGHQQNGGAEYIVLDGQQRLTAMYYAFHAPEIRLPNRANRAFYFINVDEFMRENFDDAFEYHYQSKRLQRLLDSPKAQYESHQFPLSVIGTGGWDLLKWVQGYTKFWEEYPNTEDDNEDHISAEQAEVYAVNGEQFGQYIKEITDEYQISYIELDQQLGIDKVCDIFTQVNSRGIRLDVFDLMNAMLKPKGIQLKQMYRDVMPNVDWVDTDRMNVYVLQVMSIVLQSYCSPKYLYFLLPGQLKPIRHSDGRREQEILVQSTDEFRDLWDKSVSSLVRSIEILKHPNEYGAISPKYLPYASILPVFAALESHIWTLPALERLDGTRKMKHWYWAAVFTNRYSGSVESTAARDHQDVQEWIADDDARPALLMEFENRMRNLDLSREVNTSSSTYTGIFNLLVLQGARDWISGVAPQFDDLDDHHIVPEAWSKKHLPGNTWHTILNRTPLTADTNRNVIRDRLPNQYLPEMFESSGEESMRSILASHFISSAAIEILMRRDFGPNDFEEFINERQRTITDAIQDLLIHERLDLSPRLRELDLDIERVELALRELVATNLEDDSERIPSGVRQKVQQRFEVAAKKDPSLDPENSRQMSSLLPHFDIRDIQDTLTNKILWPVFSSSFTSKSDLDLKFSQLASLRNGIRHSREVDDVTRMEGEASVLWFDKILTK